MVSKNLISSENGTQIIAGISYPSNFSNTLRDILLRKKNQIEWLLNRPSGVMNIMVSIIKHSGLFSDAIGLESNSKQCHI